MMNPQEIAIKDFTYELPDERIAKFPLEKRDESKLLLYDKGNISHTVFKNISDYLDEGELLVCNNTRVIQVVYFQALSHELGAWSLARGSGHA